MGGGGPPGGDGRGVPGGRAHRGGAGGAPGRFGDAGDGGRGPEDRDAHPLTTTTSLTACIPWNGRIGRPSGSVLYRRVSISSAGITRTSSTLPDLVSIMKFSIIPRIWPSFVITVLPRSSVANFLIRSPEEKHGIRAPIPSVVRRMADSRYGPLLQW